jgi:outer membrane protein assembly factor BamB
MIYPQRCFSAARVAPSAIHLAVPLALAWSAAKIEVGLPLACTNGVCIDPEGRLAWFGADGTRIWTREKSRSETEFAASLDGEAIWVSVDGRVPHLRRVHRADGRTIGDWRIPFGVMAVLPELRFVGVGGRKPSSAGPNDLGVFAVENGREARMLWRRPGTEKADFSPFLAVTESLILVGKGENLLAVDLETGETVWEQALGPYGGAPFSLLWLPMVWGGRALVNSANETLCFEVATGRLCWRLPLVGTRTVYLGRVYVVASEAYFIIDLESGKVLLKKPAYEGVRSKWGIRDAFEFSTSLLVSETHVFVGDTRGRMYGMVRDTWEPVWHHSPGGSGYLNAEIAVGGDRLYARTFNYDPKPPQMLHCYRQLAPGEEPEPPVAERKRGRSADSRAPRRGPRASAAAAGSIR